MTEKHDGNYYSFMRRHEGEYFKNILMDFFNQTGGSEEMEKVKEHDGCMDCVHVDLASDDYPCSECRCNYTDKYEKREETKELTRSQIREAFMKKFSGRRAAGIEEIERTVDDLFKD